MVFERFKPILVATLNTPSQPTRREAKVARLTQQKYDLTCALMKLGFEIHSGNEHLLFAAVDAYADARESKEIAELKAQIRNYELRIDSDAVELDKRYSERTELNAEIKRLRDFTEKCHKSPEKLVQVVWFADGSFDYCDLVPLQDAAAIALSPAPVTHQPDILTKILALPDDTSSAYIKALIHDQIKLK